MTGHAVRPRAYWLPLGLLCALALEGPLAVRGVPTHECSVDHECTTQDPNTVCDTTHSLCVCIKGLYREPPYRTIKCSVGKTYNERCRSPRECLIADQYSDCVNNICRCQRGYNPIPVANNSQQQGSVRCMLDPIYWDRDHAHLTFFKVSPVPLLVICIILVYLGYQRGSKVPQRRGSSTSNRRVVPMWRGVMLLQGNSTASQSQAQQQQQSRRSASLGTSSTSSASQNGQTVVNVGDLSARRESASAVAPAAGEQDSRRSRGSAHSRRDSGGRERQERQSQQTQLGDGSQAPRLVERRDSAMSPPPPYAQEEAPPSYEDAIRASRVAMTDAVGSGPAGGCAVSVNGHVGRAERPAAADGDATTGATGNGEIGSNVTAATGAAPSNSAGDVADVNDVTIVEMPNGQVAQPKSSVDGPSADGQQPSKKS